MASLKRKLVREHKKRMKKLERKISKQLNMFDMLPENCLTCEKHFDKKSKEQSMTWKTIVKKDSVRLYCPECWAMAENTIREYGEKNEFKNDENR